MNKKETIIITQRNSKYLAAGVVLFLLGQFFLDVSDAVYCDNSKKYIEWVLIILISVSWVCSWFCFCVHCLGEDYEVEGKKVDIK